jgi:hypothetical protein
LSWNNKTRLEQHWLYLITLVGIVMSPTYSLSNIATASDKVYQLLAHVRWFSPGTPASSTTKTCCHDIAEILQKVTLSSKNQIKANQIIIQQQIQIVP